MWWYHTVITSDFRLVGIVHCISVVPGHFDPQKHATYFVFGDCHLMTAGNGTKGN